MATLELAIDARRLRQQASSARREIVSISGALNTVSRASNNSRRIVTNSLNSIRNSASRVLRTVLSLRTALFTLGGSLLVAGVLRYADAWQNAQNRLRPFIGDLERTRVVQEQLFLLSQRTRQDFQESVNLFSRLTINQDTLGIDTAGLLDFTETVQQALALSGATQQEAQGALRQLSQLLGSEQIRGAGQELNSLQEQASRLFVAILDGLDLSQQEFRDLAASGQLTSRDIIDALSSVADEIEQEFAVVIPTIGQSITTLQNSLIRSIGLVSGATGFGEGAARGLIRFTGAIDNFALAVTAANTPLEQFQSLQDDAFVGQAAATNLSLLAQNPDLGRLQAIGAEDGELRRTAETIGDALGDSIISVLRFTILPEAINIITELPVFFVASFVRSVGQITPVLFDIVGEVATQFVETIIEQIDRRSGILGDVLGFGQAGARLQENPIVDLAERIDMAAAELQTDSVSSILGSFNQIGGGLQALEANFETLAMVASQGGASLNELRGDFVELGEETDRFFLSDQQLSQLSTGFAGTLVDGVSAAASGVRELNDVLRDTANALLQVSLRTIVGVPLEAGLGQFLQGFSGSIAGPGPAPSAKGNVFNTSGNIVPFQRGGVVSTPSFFPLSDGRTGLAGEAGPEAIMPLRRGADGRLGVSASGGGGGTVINMTVVTQDADSFVRNRRQVIQSLQRRGL